MIPIKERVSIRLGTLRAALQKRCDDEQKTPSRVIREALAEHLGENAPKMDGQCANLKQYQEGSKA